MNRTSFMALLASLTAASASAQVSISGADMFNEIGLYYRAYANRFDPLDATGSTAYAVPSGLIGDPGPDQFWDFSNGPTNKVFRFDYVTTEGVSEAEDFPDASIAERMTDESDSSTQWLFFDFIPGNGRMVYGYYAPNPFFTPSNVFVPPAVDFPDQIVYGQEWSTSTMYENKLSLTDPGDDAEEGGGVFDVGQRTTLTSTFKADAYGTVLLPDEIGAFGQALRINEQVTIDIAIDFGEGQYDHVETDYTRNYYWVMPGRGIVAQLNSRQSSSPPPENFTSAVAFLRLFETNKKPGTTGGGCTSPQPVTDLRIRENNGTLLLTWTKTGCASQYRVQFTTKPTDESSWQSLGEPTAGTFWQTENTTKGPMRFYRVESIK